MTQQRGSHFIRRAALGSFIAVLFALAAPNVEAAFTFAGVAAGDASSTAITLWTRGVDDVTPAAVLVTVQVATDNGFAHIVATSSGHTAVAADYTAKFGIAGLHPSTVYYYRFRSGGVTSNVGKFKTAPLPHAAAHVHFAFSGDNDGLMRPYALASVVPSQDLDFYINLGDVIYETASNAAGNNAASWLNSPAVKVSNDSLTFDGIPRACSGVCAAGTAFATQTQLFADYSRKYRENFLPVNTGGQNSLQALYAAQGNYTTWDNHELGNRKYIDGGAPAGGSVGGAAGSDMGTGRGVDARAYSIAPPNTGGSGNVLNINDVNLSVTDFMNRSTGFQTLEQVFLNYQPIADLGTVVAPADPRTNGTKRLYSAHQWGKNVVYINTDTRSYRDIRLKTFNAAADDTGSRADNPDRTYLGATQLAWLETTLLESEKDDITWKFVSISDPIDQIGPIGGSLTLVNPPSTPGYSPVIADGGKSYMGGYRAERNELLAFIADHHIKNVVFIATDDHQNRINELLYSPTGDTDIQASYVKVPHVFSIVAGPLGATGPDLLTTHTFDLAKKLVDSIVAAQEAAGVEPFGLTDYPGLHDLKRDVDGTLTSISGPEAADFYSPDTFNFTVLDVSESGKTLTVKSVGMNSTTVNTAIEYADGPQARTIFSFKIRAARDGDRDEAGRDDDDDDHDFDQDDRGHGDDKHADSDHSDRSGNNGRGNDNDDDKR